MRAAGGLGFHRSNQHCEHACADQSGLLYPDCHESALPGPKAQHTTVVVAACAGAEPASSFFLPTMHIGGLVKSRQRTRRHLHVRLNSRPSDSQLHKVNC